MRFTVAIDGPAAAGKGTIARAVAARFGLAHLDTGLIYRAVGVQMLEGADPVTAARALTPDDLARRDLRSTDAGRAASQAAAIGAVREALLSFQRAFARREGGAVLDGRDIGTVICPEAEVKLFVTASEPVRAARRHAELRAAGAATSPDRVLAEIRERDRRDAGRSLAPLRPAPDALVLDTTALSIEAAVARAIAAVLAAQRPTGRSAPSSGSRSDV